MWWWCWWRNTFPLVIFCPFLPGQKAGKRLRCYITLQSQLTGFNNLVKGYTVCHILFFLINEYIKLRWNICNLWTQRMPDFMWTRVGFLCLLCSTLYRFSQWLEKVLIIVTVTKLFFLMGNNISGFYIFPWKVCLQLLLLRSWQEISKCPRWRNGSSPSPLLSLITLESTARLKREHSQRRWLITCELLSIKNSSGRRVLKSSTEFSASWRLIHTPWLPSSHAFCQHRSVSLSSISAGKIMRHREMDLTCLKPPAGAGAFGASVQKVQHWQFVASKLQNLCCLNSHKFLNACNPSNDKTNMPAMFGLMFGKAKD